MPLFPTEVTPDMQAAERVVLMREKGTKVLLGVTIGVIAMWFLIGKVQDHFLLQQQWEPLTFDAKALTVIGTQDGRGDYDNNMFKVVQSNKATRVELTDKGWAYCFPQGEGKLFDQTRGNIIRGVMEVDGQTGFALLAPYLKAGMARFRQEPNANRFVTDDMPIDIPGKVGKPETLQGILTKYQDKAAAKEYTTDEEGVGSGGGRTLDHGLVIPGDTLVRACPVLLTTKCFTGGEVNSVPGSILNDTTYTVRLNLTPEGRSRFYRWSREHMNENIVFVVNGEVLIAGRVTQILDVNWWEINNIRDKETAESLVKVVQGGK